MNAENVIYFVSFGVEYIPNEIRKFIGNKNIIANIYRIQAYDSVMYTNLFFPNEFTKNDKIILRYFQ